eukprot:scaffold399146_cov47-Prasinocladus_malaysianus.AAC.1
MCLTPEYCDLQKDHNVHPSDHHRQASTTLLYAYADWRQAKLDTFNAQIQSGRKNSASAGLEDDSTEISAEELTRIHAAHQTPKQFTSL